MITQAIMGSEGIGNTTHSLSRQGSLYDLTLDEVQNQLGNLGKPLGSMNLDELLRTVWTAEAVDNGASDPAQLASSSSLNRQSSFPQELSKKTVEEVWKEIQQGKRNQERQNTLGEMTLEEFLAQAKVSADRDGISNSGIDPNVVQNNSQWIQYQMLPQHQRQNVVSVILPNQNQNVMQQAVAVNRGQLADSAYSDSSMSPSNLMETQAVGRKRVGDVVEKTVERRQKRMIKNRESAARSRARRQAYTQELENKVARLEEENRRLRRVKEVEKVIPSAPPPEPKYQLRRTSSSPL